MEQVGFALEDLANIGDDFDVMHSMFGGMVRVPAVLKNFFLFHLTTNGTLPLFLTYNIISLPSVYSKQK